MRLVYGPRNFNDLTVSFFPTNLLRRDRFPEAPRLKIDKHPLRSGSPFFSSGLSHQVVFDEANAPCTLARLFPEHAFQLSFPSPFSLKPSFLLGRDTMSNIGEQQAPSFPFYS